MSGQITNDFLDPSSTVTGTKRNKEDSVAVLPPKQAGLADAPRCGPRGPWELFLSTC